MNGTLVQKPKGKLSENERSILSVIAWGNGEKFSYFCGGDGNIPLESEFVEFALKDKSVTVMKLDHHGSANEFAGGVIIRGMKPKRVLVTPGKTYGHPCEFNENSTIIF